MSAIKGPQKFEDFVKHKPIERVSKLKWWFILLIVLGLIFLIWIVISNAQTVQTSMQRNDGGAMNLIVSRVFADDANRLSDPNGFPKNTVMLGVFAALGLVYFVAIFKVFFSTNPNNVDSATDLIKTLTGFFVGVGTSFFN